MMPRRASLKRGLGPSERRKTARIRNGTQTLRPGARMRPACERLRFYAILAGRWGEDVLDETQVYEALKGIMDPEVGIDIVNLGMVYGVKVSEDGKNVQVEMTLTTMGCPLYEQMERAIELQLQAIGAEQVEVKLVWSPPWSPERMSEEAKAALKYLF